MKEIRMDWKIYEEDLKIVERKGNLLGRDEVARWLQSGEKLYKFLEKSSIHDWTWKMIARSLGREDELMKPEGEE